MPTKIATSEIWMITRGDVILDPDGWRDGTCDFTKDLIPLPEYERRLAASTISLKGKI